MDRYGGRCRDGFLLYRAERTNGERDVPRAILVRPFVNLGLPQQDAWFSDALTQQVIGTLAETKAVHVVPWSSSLALKGQSVAANELGKRFQVDAILEGSIGRLGDRLRVVTQLVDVATQRTLWSHQDDRDARDLARVQDDVGRPRRQGSPYGDLHTGGAPSPGDGDLNLC